MHGAGRSGACLFFSPAANWADDGVSDGFARGSSSAAISWQDRGVISGSRSNLTCSIWALVGACPSGRTTITIPVDVEIGGVEQKTRPARARRAPSQRRPSQNELDNKLGQVHTSAFVRVGRYQGFVVEIARDRTTFVQPNECPRGRRQGSSLGTQSALSRDGTQTRSGPIRFVSSLNSSRLRLIYLGGLSSERAQPKHWPASCPCSCVALVLFYQLRPASWPVAVELVSAGARRPCKFSYYIAPAELGSGLVVTRASSQTTNPNNAWRLSASGADKRSGQTGAELGARINWSNSRPPSAKQSRDSGGQCASGRENERPEEGAK